MNEYKSKAWWPKNAGLSLGNTECTSEDTHRSFEEAVSVCNTLEKYGFGAECKIFPIKTEIMAIKDTNHDRE